MANHPCTYSIARRRALRPNEMDRGLPRSRGWQLLKAASDGSARVIVGGADSLLHLEALAGTSIINPADFLAEHG